MVNKGFPLNDVVLKDKVVTIDIITRVTFSCGGSYILHERDHRTSRFTSNLDWRFFLRVDDGIKAVYPPTVETFR